MGEEATSVLPQTPDKPMLDKLRRNVCRSFFATKDKEQNMSARRFKEYNAILHSEALSCMSLHPENVYRKLWIL